MVKIADKYFFVPVVILLLASILLTNYYNQIALVILILGIAITIPFVRKFPDSIFKISAYLLLGLSAYTLVGLAYRESVNDPRYMFVESFPVLIFAVTNAIAILITTEDKDTHGYTFAAMGFSTIFSSGLFTMGKEYGTLLLVMFVLWLLIPLILCRLFSKQLHPSTTIFRRIGRAALGIILTFPIYLVIVLLSVLVVNQLSISPETASLSIDFSGIFELLGDNELQILGLLWYYFLPHIIFIPGAYMAYQLVFFDALGYKKFVDKKTREISYIPPERLLKKGKKDEVENDPYQGLFEDIKGQMSNFKNMTNRVGAYELMQRFKNEYDTLHAKHGDTSTGEKVKDTLRSIEEKFRAQYR